MPVRVSLFKLRQADIDKICSAATLERDCEELVKVGLLEVLPAVLRQAHYEMVGRGTSCKLTKDVVEEVLNYTLICRPKPLHLVLVDPPVNTHRWILGHLFCHFFHDGRCRDQEVERGLQVIVGYRHLTCHFWRDYAVKDTGFFATAALALNQCK